MTRFTIVRDTGHTLNVQGDYMRTTEAGVLEVWTYVNSEKVLSWAMDSGRWITAGITG